MILAPVYRPFRVRKLEPDGTLRWTWRGHRLEDRGGFVRLFVPSRTPRRHSQGEWCADGISIVAVDPARPYVVHWWSGADGDGFYVDTARTIEVADGVISYVDLFLDMSFRHGVWRLLDEDELSLASAADAAGATSAVAEIRRSIEGRDPLFDLRSELWTLPPDATTLPPLSVDEPA